MATLDTCRCASPENAMRRGGSLLIAAGILMISGLPAHAESVSDLLLRKTQEFSDAGQRGDKAALARDLAPDVLFTNEDGSVATKSDIVDSAAPPPPGIARTIKVTDWKLKQYGDVAVASFVDVQTQTVFGQALTFRYRSTETWRKDKSGWRLIGSQTLTLDQDPPAATLSSEVLDEYVGTYQGGPDLKVVISRTEAGIASSVNGGKATMLVPELKDCFFVPGKPGLRRLFQRDSQGHITGYVSRSSGQDLKLSRT